MDPTLMRARVAHAIADFHHGDWEALIAYNDTVHGLDAELKAADELIECLRRQGVELTATRPLDKDTTGKRIT